MSIIYKVNLHLTENCNFKCRYCFAHFEEHPVLQTREWEQIIHNCYKSGVVDAVNFAGGEPLLFSGLTVLADYARCLGLKTSIITNGLLMDTDWILDKAGVFDTIGISVDSFATNTMRSIGRCSLDGRTLTLEALASRLSLIKEIYPNVKIKLNTVVNALNMNENMADLICRYKLPVDRWKLLKMSPFDDGRHSNADIAITDDAYFSFARKQLSVFGLECSHTDASVYRTPSGMEIVTERELKGGYIMVDAGGYLVDNTQNDSYTRVIQCQKEPLAKGLSKLTFIKELYNARYSKGR